MRNAKRHFECSHRVDNAFQKSVLHELEIHAFMLREAVVEMKADGRLERLYGTTNDRDRRRGFSTALV
jgi:hypothetical protein